MENNPNSPEFESDDTPQENDAHQIPVNPQPTLPADESGLPPQSANIPQLPGAQNQTPQHNPQAPYLPQATGIAPQGMPQPSASFQGHPQHGAPFQGQPQQGHSQQGHSQQGHPQHGQPGDYFAPPPTPPTPPGKNKIGLIALIIAIVGFVFACIPGVLIVGWILLPVAFVLALVSLFQADKAKGQGIAALIISIVGTIVAVIVFIVVAATAFDDALTDSELSISEPTSSESSATSTESSDASTEDTKPDDEDASDETDQKTESDTASSDAGKNRENPLAIGSTVSDDDWEVTINSVTLDATEQVVAENEFNSPPEDGSQYLLVNVKATYTGDDPEGSMPWVTVEYVTPGGNTINSYDDFVALENSFSSLDVVYSGASVEGDYAFTVPSDGVEDGVLAVSIGLLSETVFFAVK